MRQDDFDTDRIRSELTRIRRKAYENELEIQARLAGCDDRSARLENNEALTELNEFSKGDAQSIVNTYNFDLAAAIINIKAEVPAANRNTYVSRLRQWEEKRNAWKAQQIAEYTEGQARSMAQRDFARLNNLDGVAVLRPTEAVCPICQGWVNRGQVPLREATNNPPPYHPNCPHIWQTSPERIPQDECTEIWMGAS